MELSMGLAELKSKGLLDGLDLTEVVFGEGADVSG
jgi:hypothetical protein